ncbi:MAG: hypothetical protein IPJ28_08100 [Betaproteobacteria bacterium]|nr:hypothetical protein [Betaproteobacteria bacterium]
MKDRHAETLDAVEARASRRIGLVSLGLVTGCLLAAMAMAISAKGEGDEAAKAADCQRSERSVGAAKTAQHPKAETLLLCSSESSLIRKLF